MEIGKIFLENLGKVINKNQTSESAEANNNGIKSKEPLINDDIKNEIQTALNQVDEESTIIAEDYYAANKDVQRKKIIFEPSYEKLIETMGEDKTNEISKAHGINTTDTNNFENDVLNSQGVTYVVLTNLHNCSICNDLENALSKYKDKIEGVANLYNMSWQANADLCRNLCFKQGGLTAPLGTPQIAKFVDGQFVGLVNASFTDYIIETLEDGTEKYLVDNCEPDIIDKLVESATTKSDPTVIRAKNGLAITNADKFHENVECSTGTTYVVMNDDYHMGGADFGSGSHLTSALVDAKDELEKVANVYTLVWDDNKDAELCRKITYEMGKLPKPARVPQVAKFVDGKFVELLSSQVEDKGCHHMNVKTNPVVEEMIAKAEGTPGTIYTNKQKTENAEENVSTEDKNTENIANTEKEQKLAKLKNQIKQKEIEAKFLQNIVEEKESEIEKIREELADTENSNTWFKNIELSNLESSLNLSQTMANNVQNELFFLNNQYLNALNQ